MKKNKRRTRIIAEIKDRDEEKEEKKEKMKIGKECLNE